MARKSLPTSLHIALVSRYFPIWESTTGVHFLRLIASGLVRSGHRVTVICADDRWNRSNIEFDNIKFVMLPESPRNSLFREDRFANFVNQKIREIHATDPFHIVHSMDRCVAELSRFSKSLKIAFAYDVSATRLSKLFATLGSAEDTLQSQIKVGLQVIYRFLRSYYGGDRELLMHADGIFVSNQRERVALERYYRFPDARIHTVPYGIEVGDLRPREGSAELRRKFGIAELAPVALAISDMTDISEVTSLLEAFETVVIKKPSARLVIVGSGPRFKELEYRALSLAMGNKVIFTGDLSPQEIPDLIAAAQIFFSLGLRQTGFDPTVLEAMAQRKVVVGSELGMLSTLIDHGQNGFLVRPANQIELSRLMLEVFTGQLLTTAIGEAARLKVIESFNPQKMVLETSKAYYAILER